MQQKLAQAAETFMVKEVTQPSPDEFLGEVVIELSAGDLLGEVKAMNEEIYRSLTESVASGSSYYDAVMTAEKKIVTRFEF